MSPSPKKFAAILVAATAGAGALTAGPLLADNGRPGRGDHRNPNRAPALQQPGATQPGQQAPFIGVVVPDQPGTDRPAPRGQGPALQPGDDNAGPRVGPGGDVWQQPGARRGRSFRVTCDFVRSGMFDPIVFPGEGDMGHDHQFFGAESINPASTPASLVAANANFDSTSCMQVRDGSSYWMPALQITDSGSPVTVEPDEIRVRYSAPRRQRVRAFPPGFTLIAGDKGATTLQEYAGWRCEFDAPGTPLQASPPACDPDEAVVGVVRFPGCWDGTNLSSPTQAHMAYRTAEGCPATHPVALPELTEEVFWPADGKEHAYALSSGSTAGLHADFMNGWDQRALRNQVRRWLNRRA